MTKLLTWRVFTLESASHIVWKRANNVTASTDNDKPNTSAPAGIANSALLNIVKAGKGLNG